MLDAIPRETLANAVVFLACLGVMGVMFAIAQWSAWRDRLEQRKLLEVLERIMRERERVRRESPNA